VTISIIKRTAKVINKNGKSLWLPTNCVRGLGSMGDPDIYAQSVTQLYPLNTRLEYADGRVFRYGKFGATSTGAPIARLVGNANAAPGATGEEDVDGYEGDANTAAAIGAEYVDLEIATAYAENFFEDGMLAIYPTAAPIVYAEYRIAGSELGNGTYCRVYLDEPLKSPLAVADGITAYKSIYSQVKQIGAEGVGYVSALGVCLASAFTSAYFGWIQTWGRCIITPTAYFGDSQHERAVFYNFNDGTIGTAASYDPSSGHQLIGFLTQRTVSGYGDLEVMLMLGR